MLAEASARALRLAFYVPITLLFCIALAGRTRFQDRPDRLFVSDAFGYYMYLPSLLLDGDLELGNQIASQPGQEKHAFYGIVPETGRHGNPFQLGCAMLWSPAFLAAHGVALCLHAAGLNVQTNGFGWIYELPVLGAAFAYGLLGVWYLQRLLEQRWGGRVAAYGTGMIVLATPTAAYLSIEPGMSHAASLFLIGTLFYYLEIADRDEDLSCKAWLRIGFLCGLIAAVRATDVFIGVVVAWVGLRQGLHAYRMRKDEGCSRIAAAVICLLASAMMAFLPQMLVWKWLYGHFLVVPRGTGYESQNWLQPDVWRYLFSTLHGLFPWVPVWFIAVCGLAWGAVRRERLLFPAFISLGLAIYFTSSTSRWWAGYSFGERRMVDYSVIFALGLGYLFYSRPILLSLLWTRSLLAALVVFNWLLMARYVLHDLPEYGYVSWADLYLRTILFPIRVLARAVGAVW